MRILVTGSRNWDDHRTLEQALLKATVEAFKRREPIVIVHGAYTRGADEIAHRLAKYHGWQEEPHPADWKTHGKSAGPIRNQEMCNLGADVCLAFPLGASPGTRDCMRRAGMHHIPIINYGDAQPTDDDMGFA